MKYKSTRDQNILFTFEDALCSGYAPDGGLFVPESIPKVEPVTWKEWAKLDYIDLATTVLRLFVGKEVPEDDLRLLCQKAFAGFGKQEIVPVVPLSDKIYVIELFHGPTFCFKDLAMRVVVNLLGYFAEKRKKQFTLIVSTTGDTGPAAVQAIQDSESPNLGILVHYPEGQISDFQRKQLTTATSSKIRVVAFQGGGDDMDGPIKNIMTDNSSVSKERFICGINSYNIGRPLVQMVHFIWAYLRIVQDLNVEAGDPDFKLDIVLPTGAMGNMAGGYMAKQMGLPIGLLCAGVNINDITNKVFQTGAIQKSNAPMRTTLSEAINIQLPYNLERLLFYLTGGDHSQVRKWYSGLETSGRTNLQTEWLERLQQEFRSARVTDEELCSTLKVTLETWGYWACPNTGVAFAAAKQLNYFDDANEKTVALLATASPCKFQEAVTVALGQQKWKEYEQNHFPALGKQIMRNPEQPPIIYRTTAGKTLKENQVEWERMARELIKNL